MSVQRLEPAADLLLILLDGTPGDSPAERRQRAKLSAEPFFGCGLRIAVAIADYPLADWRSEQAAGFQLLRIYRQDGFEQAAILDAALSELKARRVALYPAGQGFSTFRQRRFAPLRLDGSPREARRRLEAPVSPAIAGSANVLVLYDEGSIHVGAIREHLDSFARYFQKSRVFYAPATNFHRCTYELAMFDVVVVHYSVRVNLTGHLSEGYRRALRLSGAFKVLFVQDDYDLTEQTRRTIDELGFHAVFTCVPSESCEYVYPSSRFPALERVSTLTGFVSLALEKSSGQRPIADRSLRIVYRGQVLPYWFGDLGQEKQIIGQKVRAACEKRGISSDIEWSPEKRIYGPAWPAFLASGRATLGTESGCNIFDEQGLVAARIERALRQKPGLTYQEARALLPPEGPVRMNQISPKIFEAIACRTALILFEGGYSGVVEPDRHFIPLKKDFSNIDQVLDRLEDTVGLERMVDRAFIDVVASGRWSYRRFFEDLEAWMLARCGGVRSLDLVTSVIGRVEGEKLIPAVSPLELLPAPKVGKVEGSLPKRRPRQPFDALSARAKLRYGAEAATWVAADLLAPFFDQDQAEIQKNIVQKIKTLRSSAQQALKKSRWL